MSYAVELVYLRLKPPFAGCLETKSWLLLDSGVTLTQPLAGLEAH